jgi:hypothetical protein
MRLQAALFLLPAVAAVRRAVETLTTLAVLVEIPQRSTPVVTQEVVAALKDCLAMGFVAEMVLHLALTALLQWAAEQGLVAEAATSQMLLEAAVVADRLVTVQMVLAQTVLAAQVMTF